MYQAQAVLKLLKETNPEIDVRIVGIKTLGDQDQNLSLKSKEGLPMGLFTKEIEKYLVEDRIDLACHSAKDLPVEFDPNLMLAAVPTRDRVEDALVTVSGLRLADLPKKSIIGTSSTRREAFLQYYYPHLQTKTIRGNVETRLLKLKRGEYDAIILSSAGLIRLGLENLITEYLAVQCFLPAPGQGALALQIRKTDIPLKLVLEPINDPVSMAAVRAEREFLKIIGGGCQFPAGAYARVEEGNQLIMNTAAFDKEGRLYKSLVKGSMQEAMLLGRKAAEERTLVPKDLKS